MSLSQPLRRQHYFGPCGDERRYFVVDEIGRGSYGRVISAKNKEGNLVAIKRMGDVNEMGTWEKVFARRELRQNMILDHPHIVTCIEHFYCGNELFLVLELAPGGTLRSFINSHGGSLREAEARWFFQQIILAVDYAHKMGVFFRDIKLENIVMGKKKEIMLCDLGFSKCARLDTGCNTFLGTPRYIAPELHEFLFSQNLGFRIMDVPEHDGKALDLFAAGVCLFVMIYGEYPEPVLPGNLNRNLNSPGLSNPLQNLSYEIPSCSPRGAVSEDCQNLIAGLLCPEPEKRFTMKEILSHPWFMTDLPEGFQGFNERAAKENVKKVLDRKLAKCPVGPLDIEGRSGVGRKTTMVSMIRGSFEKG